MSSFKYRQDMPPSGGYSGINWARKIAKPGMSGYGIFAGFFAMTAAGWTAFYFEKNLKRKQELELNDARIAVSALYLAERQRMYLRQLRRNRDEENELMKDVPGWETGKWKGEPVFHDINERFPIVTHEEYFAHCSQKDLTRRMFEHHKH